MAGAERIREQVARWRDDLLDLTRRNRLLRFRHTKTSSLEIESPAAQEIIDRLTTGRSREWAVYAPVDDKETAEEPLTPDPSGPSPKMTAPSIGPVLRTTKRTGREVRAACAGLSRRAAGEFMDRGIWVLYLGVGMLHWVDPADRAGEAQDSPLLLVPVRLENGQGESEWTVRPTEEEVLVNPALWLKLETDFGITLPVVDAEESLDVEVLLDAVRGAVVSQPAWSVEGRVVLSTFSFHKEAMYRDLRDNFEQVVANPIVAALARDPSDLEAGDGGFDFDPVDEARLDEVVPPERAMTIREADASQRQCIAAACQGRSFVMDGPPGTGKSQTIANMIAELIAVGKTVLFVSEKAAALDVVHNRLADVGLDEYALEIHSHKTTRATVAKALGASLLRRPRPFPELTSSELNEARRRREGLTRYAEALNQPVESLAGRSFHHLLGQIAALQPLPQAPVATRVPQNIDEIAVIVELARRLNSTWEVVERGEDFVWRGASATEWNATVEQRVRSKLESIASALEDLSATAEAVADDLLLDPPSGPAEAEDLGRLLAILGDRPAGARPEWISHTDPSELEHAAKRAGARARAWQNARDEGLVAIGPQWETVSERDGVGLAGRLGGVGVTLPDDALAADLERLAAGARRAADLADSAWSVAADLAASLGVRAAGLTVDRVRALQGLSEIATCDAPPAALWLSSVETSELAQIAVAEIRPLLEANTAAREAAAIFDSSALDLDLTSLARRFTDEYGGLKKLGGAYRGDRDALAATAPGVKPKEAIAAITTAVAWQQAQTALDDAGERLAATLSTAWSGADTDTSLLEAGVQRAEQAHRLAGDDVIDRARFAQAVSGREGGDEIRRLTTETNAVLVRLLAQTPKELETLLQDSLEAAAEKLREASSTTADLAAMTSRVDRIRGSAGTVRAALVGAHARETAAAIEMACLQDLEAARVLSDWSRADADPTALDAVVSWTTELRDSLTSQPSNAAAHKLTTTSPDPAQLGAALERWQAALAGLLGEFSLERRGEVVSDLESQFADAAQLLERLRDTRGDIEIWMAHATAVASLRERGLGEALRYCVENRVRVGQVVDILRRSALEAMADAMLVDLSDSLGALRSVDRDREVREFASLDRKLISDAAHRVMAAANTRRPDTILGVATIIANEAQKKRKHMPVAQLLAKTAPVAQAIKPCFMMSPLTVSQFLGPDMHFDVVIFDEASQVRPCDAVNALYRGDAMIVAGDQKQLPPTSFFEQTTDDSDEWSEDDLAEFDSVLDLAKSAGVFRSLSLRWHYRSRHEHLIAFSNHRFYGGDLVTFPSSAEQSDDLGVRLIQVDGVYRRGTTRDNPIEAHAVVDRIFAHAQRGSRSIGVVAFSEAQASFIDERLRRDPRRQAPQFRDLLVEDRLAGLFVKNLESVQGDERDVIIFSVGYGPDEHGKMIMNLGPLNRDGGWRRLNVAITRARKRVEIICSFAPEKLAPGSRTRGIDELRRYLEFAARGPVALVVDDSLADGGDPESPFEDAVLRTLRSWGHDVVSQVGTAGYRIDMAIRHPDRPGRFALGIECDGAMYHSSRVARDRDRLREQILTGLGWTLYRIWGPSWYRDRAGEERRLSEAIERSLLEPTHAPPPPDHAESRRLTFDSDDLSLDAPPVWTVPYVAAVLPAPRVGDPADPTAFPELRRMILQTVAEEAPIVGDLVIRRVVDAWGAVVSEKRRAVIQRALDGLIRSGTLQRDGNAYCYPHQRLEVVRVPQVGDKRSERDVKQIPDIELTQAVALLVKDARVVTETEAQQKTARLFGWRRTGPAITAALTRAIEELAEQGVIQRGQGDLRYGEQTSRDNPQSEPRPTIT